MNTRHLLAAAALVTVLAGAGIAARAQLGTAPSPAPGAGATTVQPQHQRSKLARALCGLDLSCDQRAQIKTILADAREARRSGTPLPRQQLISRIEGVLTPDQRTAFEAALTRPAQAAPQPAATP